MSEIQFDKELQHHETSIPGLVLFDIPVHGDNRGWFKENWQREKMLAAGLPDFSPIQNNISYNEKRGVARGVHAEPWDKYVSIAKGSVFGFWVDIRQDSETYGEVFTAELDPTKAIYVPSGVANGFQTLEDDTVYTYLVNDHWSPNANYAFVNMADDSLGINWPIPLSESEISQKDKDHPLLADVTPLASKKVLVTGANGQLGRALQIEMPNAEFVTREEFDITDSEIINARRWRDYSTIINAAAYTAVDTAETTEGRKEAWLANTTAVANLGRIATEFNITLVNISSDYVFDGKNNLHDEDEPLSPLGVYGQTKAAGDAIVDTVPKHYTIRTAWVVGDGTNFVRTMKSLASRDIKPSVVDDQIGRLTFTDDLAKGIKHLLHSHAEYGTYNLSNDGKSVSWSDIAKQVYLHEGKPVHDVTPISTQAYYEGKEGIAPRPLQSTLDLTKIKATGFMPRDWEEALKSFLSDHS
ncbi:dTDP-4-dehydrorhamnose reductase [Candidatus Saccharibacteria bacterium RIFCSPHIGHO2_01_FULL_46_30]|nr:MAG: dTDP-4-dehydrorhamnose reductase [Candidatus Saccharibacteria bacterium RIFCSPHIGHO2_01_FULL_46_30]